MNEPLYRSRIRRSVGVAMQTSPTQLGMTISRRRGVSGTCERRKCESARVRESDSGSEVWRAPKGLAVVLGGEPGVGGAAEFGGKAHGGGFVGGERGGEGFLCRRGLVDLDGGALGEGLRGRDHRVACGGVGEGGVVGV